jgi:hypothetical protein
MDEAASTRRGRLEVAIAVLIALVAMTTALSAWRTSNVGSAASDQMRAGIFATLKLETTHSIDQKSAYDQADYATQAALERAAAAAMASSGRPALRQEAGNVLTYLVGGLEKLGGPFVAQAAATPAAPLDVESEVARAMQSDTAVASLDPDGAFGLSTQYNDEKRLLTLISVVLAISLFWLGMAEVTRGRWRWTNVIVGTTIWIGCLAALTVVELASIGARGGLT